MGKLVFIVALAVSPLPERPAPAHAQPLADLGLKGTAIAKNFTHFDTTANDHDLVRDEAILRLEWSRRPVPWASAKAVVDTQIDDGDFTDGVDLGAPETGRRRSIVYVREAVLTLRHDPVELAVGKQVFAWGTGETYNPTDLLNPLDTLDPIDTEKMSVYAAAVRMTRGPTSAIAVVVPVFTPTREPLADTRWTPRLAPASSTILGSRDVPPPALGNMQYAARVKTTLHGVDVAASYFDGFERTPVLRQSTAVVAPGVTVPVITPVYSRVKVPGVDAATTWRKLEAHVEAAVRFVAADGRDDRFHGIGGLGYTWDALGVGWLQEIGVVLEYAREVPLSSRPRSPIVEPVLVPGLGEGVAFRNAIAARLRLKLTEETALGVTGLVDFDRSTNAFVQAKLSHKLTDALHVDAGVDLFTGPADTVWGRWRENDRVFAAVRYFF